MKMIFFMVLFLATLNIQGQLLKVCNVEIGYLYFGPKISSIRQTTLKTSFMDFDYQTISGISFGVAGKLGITPRLGIETGLDWTRKSAKKQTSGQEYKTIAQQLGIPLLAKLRIIRIGKISLQASAGIYSSYINTVEKSQWGENTEIAPGMYEKFDYGYTFGAGLDYDFGNALLISRVFYEQGLVSTHVFEGISYNETYGISIAYLFDWVDIVHKLIKRSSN